MSTIVRTRTVQFHRWKTQFFGDVLIFNGIRLFNCFAFDPFGRQGRRSDGWATAECFEFRVDDFAILIDFDLLRRNHSARSGRALDRIHLQFHHIAARRSSDQTGSNVGIGFIERADISRILVMIDDLLVIISREESARFNTGR